MKRILLIFLLTISFQSFAQRWKPAIVILSNSDTVKGSARLVDDRAILIKEGGNSIKHRYTYAEVKAAFIGDEKFVNSHFANLRGSNGKLISDSAFVKVLINGDIDLFYKRNPNSQESPESFIIRERDSSAVELVRKTTTIFLGGRTQIVRLDNYKNQLNQFFKNCPSLKGLGDPNYFSEKKMITVTENFMKCTGKVSNYVQSHKKKRPEFTLFGGWDISKMKFSHQSYSYYYLPQSYTYSQKPFIGIQGAFRLKYSGKFKITLEAMYKSTHIEINEVNPFSTTESTQANISVDYLKFNVGTVFTQPIGRRFKLDILGAFCYSPIISKSFQKTVTTSLGTTQSSDFPFANFETGLLLGIGLRFTEKIGLTIRNEILLSGLFNYPIAGTVTASYLYTGLTYKLNSKK